MRNGSGGRGMRRIGGISRWVVSMTKEMMLG